MQVDPAGSDGETGDVEDAASGQRLGGDSGDDSRADPDVRDGVEAGLGVECPATAEDQVGDVGHSRLLRCARALAIIAVPG